MKLIIPDRLKKGDTIGIFAISGDIKDYCALEKAKEFFEKEGYKVKFASNIKSKQSYLCGTDEERANGFNELVKDTSIKALIAARGGYGAIRILDKINYEAIKNNPKIIGGYSDVTALCLMIHKKTGLQTFISPMMCSDFSKEPNQFTKNSFFNALEKKQNTFKIAKPKIFYKGISNGILWGGNLSTIQSLCGLDFVPNEKFIFVVEEINEPVYKIDKMFTQLLNIKEFKKNLSAIVLGDFSGVDDTELLNKFFTELSKDLKLPFIGGFDFGHEEKKQTLPIGVPAVLDTNLSCFRLIKQPD